MGSQNPVTAVITWFESHARTLPWREPGCSPWGVLVSEVMLQQTPVDRVVPRWQEWMTRWPTPADLAASPVSEPLRMWDRLGYPRRARWLWECAGIITTHHGGQVPSNEHDLRQLPGIGQYTAAAICAFAFHQRALALDTNVRRVIDRHWQGEEIPAAHITQSERHFCDDLWPREPHTAAQWNAAVMELGALVCRSKSPLCHECPIAQSCVWHQAGSPPTSRVRRTQATYDGSIRQLRGNVMAALRTQPCTLSELRNLTGDDHRVPEVLAELAKDQLISRNGEHFVLGT
jgi:A/G-specific adenine glycosylase